MQELSPVEEARLPLQLLTVRHEPAPMGPTHMQHKGQIDVDQKNQTRVKLTDKEE